MQRKRHRRPKAARRSICEPGPGRKNCTRVYRFAVDSASDHRVAVAGAVQHPADAARGRATNCRADDGWVRGHSGSVFAGSGERVTIPMEQLLRDVPGVEYLYSTSQPGGALVIVRFYVDTKEEDAIVRTYNRLYSNFDRIPQGATQPLIKARSIDDVPVLAVTFWGKNYGGYTLRRIAAEVQQSVKQVENVSETTLLGGAATTGARNAESAAIGGVSRQPIGDCECAAIQQPAFYLWVFC